MPTQTETTRKCYECGSMAANLVLVAESKEDNQIKQIWVCGECCARDCMEYYKANGYNVDCIVKFTVYGTLLKDGRILWGTDDTDGRILNPTEYERIDTMTAQELPNNPTSDDTDDTDDDNL